MTAMRRILLIEDDADLAGLLDRVLADEGYAVTRAGDGQTGLHLALTRSFEAMIVDRGLPAVEGLDLIARLRSRGVGTPILVLSARNSTEDRVEGLDAGAEDYLAKPFELTELLARLRALLRRHLDHAGQLAVPGGSWTSPAARYGMPTAGRWSCPSARRRCWRCWRRGPVSCSAAASCSTGSSTTRSRRPWWTPTSTTAGASSGAE